MNHKTFTKEQKEYWLKKGLENQSSEKLFLFGCFVELVNKPLYAAAREMNLPLWLIRVSVRIFEGLSGEEASNFPIDLIKAIPPNSNLKEFWKSWNYTILMDNKHGQYNYCENNKDFKNTILKVANLFKTKNVLESEALEASELALDMLGLAKNYSTKSAASSASAAAKSLAWSISWANLSASVSSKESENSVAWAAWSAAADSGNSKKEELHYIWMKNTLVKMLENYIK